MTINLDQPTPTAQLITEELSYWQETEYPAPGLLNRLKQLTGMGQLRMVEKSIPMTTPVSKNVETTELAQGINAYLGYPANRAEILTAQRGHFPSPTPAFGLLEGEFTKLSVPTIDNRARAYLKTTDRDKLIAPAEQLEMTREALMLYATRIQSHRGLASLIAPDLDNSHVAAAFEKGRLDRIVTYGNKLSARIDELAAQQVPQNVERPTKTKRPTTISYS